MLILLKYEIDKVRQGVERIEMTPVNVQWRRV